MIRPRSVLSVQLNPGSARTCAIMRSTSRHSHSRTFKSHRRRWRRMPIMTFQVCPIKYYNYSYRSRSIVRACSRSYVNLWASTHTNSHTYAKTAFCSVSVAMWPDRQSLASARWSIKAINNHYFIHDDDDAARRVADHYHQWGSTCQSGHTQNNKKTQSSLWRNPSPELGALHVRSVCEHDRDWSYLARWAPVLSSRVRRLRFVPAFVARSTSLCWCSSSIDTCYYFRFGWGSNRVCVCAEKGGMTLQLFAQRSHSAN